ncbi:MAG: Eco57I restriction-modification methylase domain-containing protein, partial [Acidimicrobiales bacterium]
LEGRRSGDPVEGSRPPDVDDLTVLRMLRAVQYVDVGGERRRLTFRAIDVEQIGYVYEGLLEMEVRHADEPVLALTRATDRKKQKFPAEVPLGEALAAIGGLDRAQLADWVVQRTGWSPKKAAASLEAEAAPEAQAALLVAAGKDDQVAKCLAPLAAALRVDQRGQPVVYDTGARYVGPSTRRAATGAHYTPRSLAEDVAANTLEPLVYRPGPLDTADRQTWQLRPSPDILALRVADIAMGSGAFLVAACRYLADRLIEAWDREGRTDAARAVTARHGRRAVSDTEVEPVMLEARRLVAEHCLYGVDINPLAVEMAKLSLWLVTMDRERPFGFLDDRFRSGDSLLGLVSTAQLETLHVDPALGRRLHEGSFFDVAAYMRPVLQQAADLRRRITAQPVVTLRDVEHKAALLAQADTLTGRLAAAADAIVGEGLVSAKANAKDLKSRFYFLGDRIASALDHDGDEALLSQEADVDLQAGRPPGTSLRQPLHWPLAFPEVFADTSEPGFDAIIGNPPFLGGQKQTSQLGHDYRASLQRWDGNRVKGSADLVAFFVLRANRLLSRRGQLGYIATNTLVQGDTLEVGLLQAAADGLTIRRGQSSHKWPSRSANLEIVNLWATRAPLAPEAHAWLDEEDVPQIGADLEPVGRVPGRPLRLRENESKAFQGSNVLGLGFTLDPADAAAMIDRDPTYADVLQPYVIGRDLNQRPDCSASRWIINFREWPLERCEQYPQALDIVRRLVKPERDRNRRAQRRERWWIFAERAPELYDTIAGLDHVLALARVSSTIVPVRVPTDVVYSEKCVLFPFDDFAHLAVLSSSAHTVWVVRYTSTLRTDINYSPSDVFDTFPRPAPSGDLEDLGQILDTERRDLMLSRAWGLTTTYNHVHDPTDTDPVVVRLREIHAAIDRATFDAYGWHDINPEIGHHRTKIGIRWTLSPEVRFEVLDRLLAENHSRHAVESGRPGM